MELGNTRTRVFTSTTGTQIARETEELGHGVFTKHLLDGLKGAADRNGDGTVDSEEVFRYISTRMEHDHGQKPRKFNFSGSSPILLRKTGLHPHRDTTRKMLRQIHELHHDGMIPLKYMQSFQSILNLRLDEMSLDQEKQFRLLERSLTGPFKPGPLIDDWDKLEQNPPVTPPVETVRKAGPRSVKLKAADPEPAWKAELDPAEPKASRQQSTPSPKITPRPSRFRGFVRLAFKAILAIALVFGLLLFVNSLRF